MTDKSANYTVPNYVLSIDTAMNGCSVAILDAGTGESFSKSEVMDRGQAERLVPMIQQVINHSNIDKKRLALIVVTRGPGTFTGLRIGLSAARSFGLALDVPVIGITTFEALADQYFQNYVQGKAGVLVAVETRREDYYGQFFSYGGGASMAVSGRASDLMALAGSPYCICGDAARRLAGEARIDESLIIDDLALIDPVSLAELGMREWKEGRIERSPEPFYLRGADVSISKTPPRSVNTIM